MQLVPSPVREGHVQLVQAHAQRTRARDTCSRQGAVCTCEGSPVSLGRVLRTTARTTDSSDDCPAERKRGRTPASGTPLLDPARWRGYLPTRAARQLWGVTLTHRAAIGGNRACAPSSDGSGRRLSYCSRSRRPQPPRATHPQAVGRRCVARHAARFRELEKSRAPLRVLQTTADSRPCSRHGRRDNCGRTGESLCLNQPLQS